MVEFGVHGVEGQACAVIGRCYRGPLRVGVVLRRFEDRAGRAHGVELVVDGIEAYGRRLSEIDEGITARLFLRGDGWGSLEDVGILFESV